MQETSKIELHGDISIPFLKKSRFTGSFKGMRYVLIKHEKELEPATEETTGEDGKRAPGHHLAGTL